MPLTQSKSTAILVMNLPAEAIQLPYAILSPGHTEWRPQGVDARIWRCISLPLLGVVFWWLPGRALEALAAARHRMLKPRIGWVETIVGFVLMAVGITILIGCLVFSSPEERRELASLATAGGLWALLGGIGFVTRIVQWRVRKKSRA